MVIIVLVLSFQQFEPINDFPDEDFAKEWESICSNDVIEYLSPFVFTATFSGKIKTTGQIGCQWRIRNTIFRLTVVFTLIILIIITIIILLTHKYINTILWPILYWFHWFLFVMMFVVFVIDCDGLNTGYNSCLNNFYVDDQQILFRNYNEDYIDQCHLIPYINMIFADLATVIVGFCVYRICRYYPYNNNNNNSNKTIQSVKSNSNPVSKSNNKKKTSFGGSAYNNVGTFNEESNDDNDNGNVPSAYGAGAYGDNNGLNEDTPKNQNDTNDTNNTNTTRSDDSPDPFEPFKKEDSVNDDVGGGAYGNSSAYD